MMRQALQDWLGHRSIQHTVRYTELSPTQFKDNGADYTDMASRHTPRPWHGGAFRAPSGVDCHFFNA